MPFIHHPTPSTTHTSVHRAVTIGNFDGVHIGHVAILDELVRYAKSHSLTPTVVTFAPNPKAFFAQLHGKVAPRQISPLRDKVMWLNAYGVVDVVVLRFNQTLAQMPAQSFIDDFLVQSLNTKHILVGNDFRFGAQRLGDVQLLRASGERQDFTVKLHDDVQFEATRISSTDVRQAIAAHKLDRATALLGHALTLSGHIMYGAQLGRTIGVPTINLEMPVHLAAQGVFVVTVAIDGAMHQGVASIGTRPSVANNGDCWCEAHLFDFDQNVYGKIATVNLIAKIRDEVKFDGMDALMAAIHQDLAHAQNFFKNVLFTTDKM